MVQVTAVALGVGKTERCSNMRYRFLRFPEGKAKAVTLSYDDGCRQDIRFAQVLDRYGIKCTFNLNSGLFGEKPTDWRLSAEEIKTHLLDKGHEVAVHGRLHRAPGLCRPVEVMQEYLSCRMELEKTFGRIIRGMAYPDSGIRNFQCGADYSTTRRILQDMDIAYARTLAGDNDSFKLPEDWYAWMPTAKHTNPQILEYAQNFVDLQIEGQYIANYWPRLFYMWGHTYEFDGDNNWDHLEKICQILGNREDIWYATNIEICNYVKAYEALEMSADGSMIYNPTVYKLWMNVDGKQYVIEPGQTITVE